MIRVALLSFWHVHALGYVQQLQDNPDTELVAAWDDDTARGRGVAEQVGVEFTDDLNGILRRPDVDAVLVQTPTTAHRDVILAAAKARKHVYSDKVLAPTLREAIEIVGAVDTAKVALTVGMTHTAHNYALRLQELITSGDIGSVVTIRMTNGHGMAIEDSLPDGFYREAEAAGGALIDMCHVVYLLPFLYGSLPRSVVSSFASWTRREVEDSAVVLAEFESGAHSTLEASFATPGAARFEIQIDGTAGSAYFRADSHPTALGAPPDSSLVARIRGQDSFGVVPLGNSGQTPLQEWVEHIKAGTRPDENIARALDLSKLVEGAYLSALRRKSVLLSEVGTR